MVMFLRRWSGRFKSLMSEVEIENCCIRFDYLYGVLVE